jgi:rhamnose transport system permease protein
MNWIIRRARPEQVREFSLLLLIAVAVFIFGSMISNYYSARTFERIAAGVAIMVVVGLGQTLVMLTRNIDVSVGSIVGFTAYYTGTLVVAYPDLSPFVVVLAAVAQGAVMGAINGALVAWGGVPSIIVTLGTLAIYRGILVQFSAAQSVTVDRLPHWLFNLPRSNLLTIGGLGIPVMVALAIGAVVLFQLATKYLNAGRRLYALGSNPDAARLIGIPAGRILFMTFVLSGMLSGLGGFMTIARFGNITVSAGTGLELQVIAAVVVGGVSILGGSGSAIGAMLGATLIGTLEQSLLRLQINEFWRDAILGLLILVAVGSDALILNHLRALWSRSELKETSDVPPSATLIDGVEVHQ